MLVGDTYTLINYVSFINYLCYGVTIIGLIVLRWKKPKIFRPIKVKILKLNLLAAIQKAWEEPKKTLCPPVVFFFLFEDQFIFRCNAEVSVSNHAPKHH